MSTNNKNWTLIFLIYADFSAKGELRLSKNLMLELDSLFGDLYRCDLKDNLKVYVIFNSIKFIRNELLSAPSIANKISVLTLSRNDNADDNSYKNNFSSLPLEPDISNLNLDSSEGLNRLFGVIKNDNDFNNASRKIIITWDHGAGFGIFKKEDIETNVLEKWKRINEFTEKHSYLDKVMQECPELAASNNQLEKYEVFQTEDVVFAITDKSLFPILTNIADNKESANVQAGDSNEVSLNFLLSENRIKEYANTFNTLHKQNKKFNIELTNSFEISSEGNDGFTGHLLSELAEASDVATFFKNNNITSSMNRLTSIEGFLNHPNIRNSFAATIDVTKSFQNPVIILTNEEIAQSISNNFGEIDVLLMMNCFMMNLLSAYSLKHSNCVKYFVAPQGGISIPGYNYAEILETLSNNPIISSDEIAKICVDSSFSETAKKKADSLIDNGAEQIEEWSIFMLKLKSENNQQNEFNRLIDLLNEFITVAETSINNKDVKLLLKYTRMLCISFSQKTPFGFIDLTHWLKSVNNIALAFDGQTIELSKKDPLLSSLNRLNKQIFDILSNDKFIYHKSGNNIYKENKFGCLTCHQPSGLSITFPVNKTKSLSLMNLLGTDENPNPLIFKEGLKNWLTLTSQIMK